jgi:deoxyribodipyrimidine photolyase-related protein
MRRYQQEVLDSYEFEYVTYEQAKDLKKLLTDKFVKKNTEKIIAMDIDDYSLNQDLEKLATGLSLEIEIITNEGFLTDKQQLEEHFADKDSYYFTKFYIAQRKRLDILVDGDGKPEGGQWSYDPENRKKLPRKVELPEVNTFGDNKYVKEASEYVEKNFADHYGRSENFAYPTNHKEAKEWLDQFLLERFDNFGPYEDAIDTRGSYLFHSVLTASLNIGLITPDQVVEDALKIADEKKIPLNSLEGFIRQIIGWREYMRAVYIYKGEEQRNSNFFRHKRKLKECWYDASTGIEPVDYVITKVNETAYSHHIERLMVMGNIMLLCEIHPDEAYRWFMEMYIDSYDWVMVPNVYGMSQYSDGGEIVTKPYISSSNYILKMSNFSKEGWCEIWDGLYWRFIDKHKQVFANNHRMRFMVSQLERLDEARKERIFAKAEDFIARVTD